MTTKRSTGLSVSLKELVADDADFMKMLMKQALQEVLEAEMTEQLGAASSERSDTRNGYRAGYYNRGLITRIGKLGLRVPRDRNGQFSTALFERCARSEKALVAALAEMYVQGVSTRKVKAITEELCGHSFSASAISSINPSLLEPAATAAFTSSGFSALRASRERLVTPLLALTPQLATARRLALLWGVPPIPFKEIHDVTEMVEHAIGAAVDNCTASPDDVVTIIAGLPSGVAVTHTVCGSATSLAGSLEGAHPALSRRCPTNARCG